SCWQITHLNGSADTRHARLAVRRAVQLDPRNSSKPLPQLAAELLLVLPNRVDAATFQPTDGRHQSNKPRHVVVTRFKLIGNRFGLSILVTLGAGSALSDA